VVIWESVGQDGDDSGIFGQRFDSTGTRLGSEFRANTFTTSVQCCSDVAANSLGDFIVVWTSYRQVGSRFTIFGQRFDNLGSRVGSEFQVSTVTNYSQTSPRVAMNGSGEFEVVWRSYAPIAFPLGMGIIVRSFDSAGGRPGSEFRVNTPDYNAFDPDVAADASGGFAVVWERFGSYYGLLEAQRLDSSGGRLGGEFQVNEATTDATLSPDISGDASGGFVVVWNRYDYDFRHPGILARRFDSSGAPEGHQVQVSTSVGMDILDEPVVTSVGTDRFVVVWSDENGDGSYYGVIGRRVCNTGDVDGDGFSCPDDCPNTYNPDQQDGDADGIGDACEVEICDGLDNNGNGQADEGNPDGGAPCITGQAGVCAAGTVTCVSASLICVQDVQPTVEICDGLDNDCNGQTDEDLGITTCGVGSCQRTVANCVAGVPQMCASGVPTAEVCNGIDDDCDATTDEELGSTTCGFGVCARTVASCVSGVLQICVPGSPTLEVCNGLDDDCDGQVDEGITMVTVTVNLTPSRLWPPNHRMVGIDATVIVNGGCSGTCTSPPSVVLVGVTSNEPDDDNGVGDGHTANDIHDAVTGTADFDFELRAERDGTGNGRLYQVTYKATDCQGNVTLGAGWVLVPHDENGKTEPMTVSVEDRSGGNSGDYALAWDAVPGATAYNVLRGRVSSIRAVGSFTVLDNARCVARGLTTNSVSGGLLEEDPTPGQGFFYVTEYLKGTYSGYGTETARGETIIASGDSCH